MYYNQLVAGFITPFLTGFFMALRPQAWPVKASFHQEAALVIATWKRPR